MAMVNFPTASLSSAAIAILINMIFCVNSKEIVKIKIVDSPALSRFTSPSNSQQKLALRTQPSNVTGPPHLRQLNGSCFEGIERGYRYRICPFQNVTQKEERQSWMSYHGVLGVWQDWIVENDTFIGFNFVMGEQCGAVDREAKVMLNCSTKTRVHNITEPSTCSYKIWLDTPLACFKGSMQVYQVLTHEQLEEWDKAEHEYYSNEITFQGLTKRRRRVLIKAGLYNPPKQEHQETDSKPPKESVDEAKEVHKADANSNMVLQCQQEKQKLQWENEALEKKLRETNLKLIDVAKAYPNVAALLNYNNSVNASATAVNSVSNMSTKVNSVKGNIHEPSDSEEHKLNLDNTANKDESIAKSPGNDRELIALLHKEDLPPDQV